MNANELADWFDGRILYLWDAEDGQYYDSAIADEIVPMLRQQQALIEQLEKTQDYLYKTHDKDKAEIEALKAENRVLRKGELWLGMVYNNRGMGIAPMYLENFMRFCETTGFTETSGYKLFKEQEK